MLPAVNSHFTEKINETASNGNEAAGNPSNAMSINDLYAMGKEQELAKKKFTVQEPENPLQHQTVAGKGNHIEGDDVPLTILVPNEEKPDQSDPLNEFSVSESPKTDGSGKPINLINPIPEEKSAVSVVMPDEIETKTGIENIEKHTQTPVDISEKEGENPELKIPSEPKKTPVSSPSVTVIPPSDLELEIKPSAEENTEETEEQVSIEKTAKKVENLEPYDPMLELRGYKYPKLDLLDLHGSEKIVTDPTELETHKNQILETLKNYDISIQRISATVGPTVTLYEIVPAPGVRISRIKNLEDDIALSLAALGIRIIAPIPGKGTIGIEVPNVRKTVVSMRTLLSSEKFQNTSFSLPIAIGKKIDNEHFVVDLASMPHLLMAGATGQGKSVGINAVLVSLLYKKHPSQLKLVLVDPKKVELSLYRAIERHFLAKLPGEEEAIITDTKKVVHTLNALCIEMDNRYDLLKEAGVRNIKEYNEKFIKRRLNPEKGHQFLPFIVLVVDEFADLIMTAGKEIEMPIARLAQLARAVGIHLIIATQRPSVNIITGTIKANFPSRVAFKVSSKIDSRTILDAGGAEQLIGKGDMLISHNGELIRLQCAFVDTPEVERVCEAIGEQRGYPEAFLLPEYVDEKEIESRDFDINDRDSLFDDAAKLIVQHQQGSTSLIQRRMKLGYNRAGRLMDQLEQAGIVGPNQGSKPRDVLVKTEMDLREILERF
jgi:S-DNA-T family DNA segregation ATPase FtsK/SpoIIIE